MQRQIAWRKGQIKKLASELAINLQVNAHLMSNLQAFFDIYVVSVQSDTVLHHMCHPHGIDQTLEGTEPIALERACSFAFLILSLAVR